MEGDKDATLDGKKDKRRPRGFKLTFGRCFDFFIIAINIVVFLFSFVAFICICIMVALSAQAANDPSENCLLFAGANTADNVIKFGSSSFCSFVIISPPIIWCFLVFFVVFLFLKIWRAWNISFFELIVCGIAIACLVFAVIATLTLTIGHSVTCNNVGDLNIPTTSNEQSCTSGGAYYTGTERIEFEGLMYTAEVTLWITCILLLVLSLIHFFRIVVFSRRKINKEKMKTKLAIEESVRKDLKTPELEEKTSPT